MSDGRLHARAPDGSWFAVDAGFGRAYTGPPDLDGLAAAAAPPDAWGILLVRKGGFAVARLAGTALLASKVGQRHVQGRTKAGGQSQQRFARRRANQAHQAYAAAADHAARVLGPAALLLVTGGDRAAIGEVLDDPRVAAHRVVGGWIDAPEPRRAALDAAIERAQALTVTIHDSQRDAAHGSDPVAGQRAAGDAAYGGVVVGDQGPDQRQGREQGREQGQGSEHEIDAQSCAELLGSTTVGRVAFVGDSGIVLRPVNFRVEDDTIYFRIASTGGLAQLVDHDGEVVFEVDHHGTTSRAGWSVLTRGRAHEVPASERGDIAALDDLVPWAGGERSTVIALEVDHLTGRHVRFHPA